MQLQPDPVPGGGTEPEPREGPQEVAEASLWQQSGEEDEWGMLGPPLHRTGPRVGTGVGIEEEQDHRAAGELESLGLGLQGGGREEEVREVINEPGEAGTGPIRGGKDNRFSLGGAHRCGALERYGSRTWGKG